MNFRAIAAVVPVLAMCAVSAHAQQGVKIEFHRGQVTLHAQNAPVRAILAEWARLGGTTIVNGDRITGPPVTLELRAVPERQALDIVLRSVAGYMLAPRPIGMSGASSFDRILILPTSVGPRTPPQQQPPNAGRPGQRVVRPPQIIEPEPTESVGEIEEEQPVEPPVQMPRPGPRMVTPGQPFQQPFRQPQPVGVEPQVIRAEDDQEQQPEMPTEGVAPTPANPFGVPFGSSAQPGVVTPNPQQRQPAGAQPQR